LGNAITAFARDTAISYAKSEIIKRTVMATLFSAMWPIGMLKAGKLLDNPWSIAFNRCKKAGQLLADVLINRGQGNRPVSLIGFSLGARIIYTAMLELARRRAFGIIENVIVLGTPAPVSQPEWAAIRTMAAGRVVNVYSDQDYILAWLYRTASIQYGVAGLQPVLVQGIENMDASEKTLSYKTDISDILEKLDYVH